MNNWLKINDKLTRTFSFPKFSAAIEFVNKVANIAEELDHHPDIYVRYKNVTLELTTHSAGGITEKDHDLAKRINELA